MKNFLGYFTTARAPAPPPNTAAIAKERLHILITHERSQKRGNPDYLPALKEEILAVVRKYASVEAHHIRVRRDQEDHCEVLEVNITLPQDETGSHRAAVVAPPKEWPSSSS